MIYSLTHSISSHLIVQYAIGVLLLLVCVELLTRVSNGLYKRIIVFSLSVILLGWLDPRSLVLLSVFSVAIFLMIKARLDIRHIIYPLSLGLIGVLVAIKDIHQLIDIDNPYVPLGVSYYFFRLISFLIEYSKQPDKISEVKVSDYFSWVFFFPIFLAGPILRFSEFQLLDKDEHQANKLVYYRHLVIAVLLKILVVDLLLFNFTYDTLYGIMNVKFSQEFVLDRQYLNILYVFCFSFSAFIHAYLDLLLYTEISKALANIFGFSNVENFNRPLLASNISAFWQRWHISLSNWTRDYIFFPMLVKTKRTWPATYASMLIIGIWHAASLNWIVWALAHGTAINLYGEIRKTSLFKSVAKSATGALVLRVSGNLVTVIFVGFVFVFVAIHDFGQVMHLLGNCF
jgi:alginate O-acetyltransferase complex protein AlgI